MKHTALKSACYRLDQLVYKTGGVDFHSPWENSPTANVNRRLYERCFWVQGMVRSKLADNTPDTSKEVEDYEELLHALECTNTDYPLLQEAIRMLNACEAVFSLLKAAPKKD